MDPNVKLLKALADETRLRILCCFIAGEACACSVVPSVGKAQSTVSQHLRILEEAGILESRRVGINIWYRIKSKDAMKILKILGQEANSITQNCEVRK